MPSRNITLKASSLPTPSSLASFPLTDTTIWLRDGLSIHTHAPLLAAIRCAANNFESSEKLLPLSPTLRSLLLNHGSHCGQEEEFTLLLPDCGKEEVDRTWKTQTVKFLIQVEQMLNEVLGGNSSITTKQLLGGLGLMVFQSKEEVEGEDTKMEVKMEMEEPEDNEALENIDSSVNDFKFSDDEDCQSPKKKKLKQSQDKNSINGVRCEKQLSGMFNCIEDGCSKEFKCVELVRKHWRTMHCPEMQAMVPCELCGKEVAKKLIARHILQKHSVGPFKCDQCERSFSTSTHLKLHQDSRHDPTRPVVEDFPCNICGKILHAERSLKKHLKTHEKNKNLDTPEGILNEQIKSMMLVSNVDLPKYGKARICKVCGKQGAWNDIRKHIEAHHITGVTHTCNFCWNTYKSLNSLAAHKSQKHRNQVAEKTNVDAL